MSNYYFLWLCTEQWELIYYVAFIVLTIGLVIFAAKTYECVIIKRYRFHQIVG